MAHDSIISAAVIEIRKSRAEALLGELSALSSADASMFVTHPATGWAPGAFNALAVDIAKLDGELTVLVEETRALLQSVLDGYERADLHASRLTQL